MSIYASTVCVAVTKYVQCNTLVKAQISKYQWCTVEAVDVPVAAYFFEINNN